MAVDRKSGQLRYLPDKRGNDEMESGVTLRAYLAGGMLLCPMPGCGPFGRVVAGGARRHDFAHPAEAGNHDHGTGPEKLGHLSAKDVLLPVLNEASRCLTQKPYLNRSWNVWLEQASRPSDLPVVRA
ncbi:hypothetical protein [Streptomyces sp. NPDC000410]|uniref:hypothetical protein n=1 Tax=Streptomyces sp. NPDC000410 TaxID=3154254 RepID=UPI003327926B